ENFKGGTGKLRDKQEFACRTSIVPPPNPDTGPCVTDGTIGRVQLKGNMCPIDVRTIDPDKMGIDENSDVYKMLKKIALGEALHKRNDNSIHVSMTTPSMWRATKLLSANDKVVAGTFLNTASSLTSFTKPDTRLAAGEITGIDKLLKSFVPDKANYALDQI